MLVTVNKYDIYVWSRSVRQHQFPKYLLGICCLQGPVLSCPVLATNTIGSLSALWGFAYWSSQETTGTSLMVPRSQVTGGKGFL